VRKPLESKIQRDVNNLLSKFSVPVKIHKRSFPDYQYLCTKGVTFFIEFKRPGKKPRPDQLKCHEVLRRLGFIVLVHDGSTSPDEFYQEVKSWITVGTPLLECDVP
jgi:hypothetical protein